MTGRPDARDDRSRRRGLLVLLALFAVAVPFLVQPTTAAWTDDARFGATVTAGTWATAPTPTCVVRNPSGNVIRNCTATATITSMWQQGPGTPWTIQYSVSLTQGPGNNQTAEVVIDLSQATGTLPAGFTWAQAGINGGWTIDTTATRCADLPVVTGRLAAHQSGGGIQVVQNRTTQGPVTCI